MSSSFEGESRLFRAQTQVAKWKRSNSDVGLRKPERNDENPKLVPFLKNICTRTPALGSLLVLIIFSKVCLHGTWRF